MNSPLLFFVFGFILFESAKCKSMCEPKDIECTTRAISNFYKILVAGVDGLTDPLDPLHVDRIEGKLESVKYELTNVTMTGFKDCKVKKFIFNRKESNHENDMVCPQLIINYNYVAKENEGPSEIIEKGSGSVTANDYEIKLKGSHAKAIVGNDPVPHFYIVAHNIETITNGKITIERKNNYNADKSKFSKILTHISKNWSEIDEKYLRSPIMEKFMALVIKNADTVVRTLRPETLFPVED